MPRQVAPVWLCAVILYAAGCGSQLPESKPTNQPGIRGAGATFPAPLYRKWIAEYEQAFPERQVSYRAVGSGEGVKQFLAESIDFGASDAALTDEEIAEVKRGALLIPVTAGSIVLAYNLPEITGQLRLSRKVYADIFMGKITRWNDKQIQQDNPHLELPDKEIFVVARQDSSGTTFAFTNHLNTISEEWPSRSMGVGKVIDWRGNAMLANGNEAVAAQIQRSTWTIGYVQYGIAKSLNLPMAELENKAGNFVSPTGDSGLATLENVKLPDNLREFFADPSGPEAYPLVTLTWLLVYEKYDDPATADAVKHFISWCLNEGQAYCAELGYLPLAPGIQSAAAQKLNNAGGRADDGI